MAIDYREIFEQVKAQIVAKRSELEACFKNVHDLQDEITGLQQTAAGLAKTLREEYVAEGSPVAITDAIRCIFRQNPQRKFTALEIRDELRNIGYSLHSYGNVMASIHSVLNRISARELQPMGKRANGKPVYMWKPDSSEPVMLHREVAKMKRLTEAPHGDFERESKP